jgi:hypothetical protein
MQVKRRSILGLVLIVIITTKIATINAAYNIIVRPAQLTDLPSVLDLDWHVTMEYFKPLYLNNYLQLPIGKDPDYYLTKELINDEYQYQKYR